MEPTTRIEELLAHGVFVRRLARQLVGDADAADDVMQEAWLATIERPPHGVTRARSWLARVVRRAAGRQARSEQRRKRREREVARGDEAPATVCAREREQAIRELSAAVLALPEPYRRTVLLSFYEARTPAEIAEQEGVSRKAIYSRLERGVAKLRESMTRSRELSAALLVLSRAPIVKEAPVAVAALSGGLLMSTTTKLVILATLSVVVGLAWWMAADERSERPGATSNAAPRAATAAESSDDPAAATLPLQTDPFTASADAVVAAATEKLIRVVDDEGRPAPGVMVVRFAKEHVIATGRTDTRGSWMSAVPQSDEELVLLPRSAPAERRSLAAGPEAAEFMLTRREVVSGHVSVDGEAPSSPLELQLSPQVEDALFPELPTSVRSLLESRRRRDHQLVAQTDAQGRFRFSGLSPSFTGILRVPAGYRLDRAPPETLWAEGGLLLSRPLVRLGLELRRLPRLEGRVVVGDPRVPLAGARGKLRVARGIRSQFIGVQSGEDGRFSVVIPKGPISYLELTFSRPAVGDEARWWRGSPGDEDIDAGEIRFPEARFVTLQVRDPSGRAIPEARAEISGRARPGRSDEAGELPIHLTPRETRLKVSAAGYRAREVEIRPATESEEIVLERGNRLRIRRRPETLPPGEHALLEVSVPSRPGKTWLRQMPEGSIELSDLPARVPLEVELRSSMGSLLARETITLGEAETRDLRLEIDKKPWRLAIRVSNPRGEALVGARVTLRPAPGTTASTSTRGGGLAELGPFWTDVASLEVTLSGYRSFTEEAFKLQGFEELRNIVLEPGNRVRVRVLMNDGSPGPREAELHCQQAAPTLGQVHDRDYVFLGLPDERVRLELRLGGVRHERWHETHQPLLEWRLPKLRQLEVDVDAPLSEPEVRWRVVLEGEPLGAHPLVRALTPEKRQVAFRHLPEGRYEARLERRALEPGDPAFFHLALGRPPEQLSGYEPWGRKASIRLSGSESIQRLVLRP